MAKTSVSASSIGVRRAASPGSVSALRPGQRVLGAGEGAHGQVAPPGLEQQGPGPRRVTRPPGQVGGEHAPCAGHAGMGRLHRGQGAPGQQCPLRRQQRRQHRLVGQRVPEPEALPVRRDQLQAHAAPQRRHDRGVRHAGDRAQQRPVETAAEHRGRAQDVPGIRVHRIEAPPHRVRERGRDGRRHQVRRVPAAVPLGQGPLPDQARQDLLDQERDALGLLRDERLDRVRQLGGADARHRHPGHRGRVQPGERQHGGGSARLQRGGEDGGLAALLVPQGAGAQHPLR
jgi:hypothetical protein